MLPMINNSPVHFIIVKHIAYDTQYPKYQIFGRPVSVIAHGLTEQDAWKNLGIDDHKSSEGKKNIRKTHANCIQITSAEFANLK